MIQVKSVIYLAGTGDGNRPAVREIYRKIDVEWNDQYGTGSISGIPSNLKTRLLHYYNNSANAKALIDYFINNNIKVLVACTDQTTMGTATMGERKDNYAGLTLNTSGQVPWMKGGGSGAAAEVEMALCVLHEMGHLWQRQEAKDWYEAQKDFSYNTNWTGSGGKTRWAAVGSAFLTLDHNNLKYWEHPICKKMGLPVRNSYYLYQPDSTKATAAANGFAKLHGVGSSGTLSDFFTHMYALDSVSSSWRWVQTHVNTQPDNTWTNNAPTRVIISE